MTKLFVISLVFLLALVRAEGATNNIQAGQTIVGAIASPGQSDYFSFSATNGESVTILMGSGDLVFTPQVELYAPNGSVLVSTAANFSVTIGALLLTNTGNYLIVCRDAGGVHSGDYGLSLIKNPDSNLPDPDGGVILPGERKTGNITLGDLDAFSFSATNGESVTILMGSGDLVFTPQLELYAPNGSLLVSTAASFSVTIRALLLTNTGNYLIVCRDALGFYSGEYGLSLIKNPDSNLPDPDGGVILPGERKTGNIEFGDLDAFSFSATNGESVTILMGSTDTLVFSPQLELYGPNGKLLAVASGVPCRLSECLDQTGTYLIICRDVIGVYSSDYDISLNLLPLAPIPPSDPYPHLAFSFCGDRLRLRWLTNAVGFQLESTATLELPNSWSVVTNTPELNLDQYVLGMPHTEPRKFFRLRHP